MVAALRDSMEGAIADGPVTAEAGQACYSGWTDQISTLQTLLNDSSIFLPAFDVRKAQKDIDALLEAADDAKTKITPRRKFAFQRKPGAPAAASSSSAASSSAAVPPAQPSPSMTSGAGAGPSAASSASSSASAAQQHRYDEDEYTIENLSNQTIFLPCGHFTGPATAELAAINQRISSLQNSGQAVPPDLHAARRRAAAAAQGKDIRLLNLTDCVIIVLDPLKAMRMDGLTRCRVYSGPIAGSVLLHRCEASLFMLVARQFRLHTSTKCDFYISPQSRPIIEHCKELRFAPYGVKYQDSGAVMAAAGLDKQPRPDMWLCVDDFGWHRVQKSPNWSVIPLVERIGYASTSSAALGAGTAASSATGGDDTARAAAEFGPDLEAAAVEKGLSIEYPADTGERSTGNYQDSGSNSGGDGHDTSSSHGDATAVGDLDGAGRLSGTAASTSSATAAVTAVAAVPAAAASATTAAVRQAVAAATATLPAPAAQSLPTAAVVAAAPIMIPASVSPLSSSTVTAVAAVPALTRTPLPAPATTTAAGSTAPVKAASTLAPLPLQRPVPAAASAADDNDDEL